MKRGLGQVLLRTLFGAWRASTCDSACVVWTLVCSFMANMNIKGIEAMKVYLRIVGGIYHKGDNACRHLPLIDGARIFIAARREHVISAAV